MAPVSRSSFIGDAVTEYRLLTIRRIEARLENVCAAIHNSPRRPDGWPDSA